LLLALASGLVVCLGALFLVRRAVFAWMAALLATATYVTFLTTQNLLGLELHRAALRLLPLVLLAGPALLCEGRGRVRWALPFHLVALVALVGCVDAMAVGASSSRWTAWSRRRGSPTGASPSPASSCSA
ncbi:MAG: hypothetical protein ACE5JG_11125, partial [Planctomycetota bacterium]